MPARSRREGSRRLSLLAPPAAVADGKAKGEKAAKGEPDGGPKKGPPPGPRKKKKRTGRRR